MSAFISMVSREIRVWYLVPAAGLLGGLVVLAAGAASVKGATSRELGELLLLIAPFFLLAAVGVLAVGAVARDLGGSRSAFFLSRPVSPAGIYLAKLVAGWVLGVVATALFIVPGLIAGGRFVKEEALGVTIGALVVLILITTLAVLLRARTFAILLYVAAAVGFVVVTSMIGGILNPFGVGFGSTQLSRFFYGFRALGFVAAVTLVAQLVGFSSRRWDLRGQSWRVGVVSAALLGVAALLVGIASWTLIRIPLSQREAFWGHTFSADGSVALIQSRALGTYATHALDVETGRSIRLPFNVGWWQVGMGGDSIVYPKSDAPVAPLMIRILGEERARETPIRLNRRQDVSDVSPDGSLIAIRSDGGIEVFDLKGRKIGAIPSEGSRLIAHFEPSGKLLIQDALDLEPSGDSSMIPEGYRVRRFDPSRGTVEELSRFAGHRAIPLSHARALVRVPVEEPHWQVVDVTSGEGTLEMAGKRPVPLSDGRWAFLDESGGVLLTTDGGRRPVGLNDPSLIGELAPGLLLVWSRDEGAPRNELQPTDETHVVDLTTGRSVASWKATRPVLRPWVGFAEPGSPALSLVETEEGLRRVDVATLQLVPVLK